MHAGAVMQTELACSLSGCDDSTAAAELYSLSLSLSPVSLDKTIASAMHKKRSLSNFSPLRVKL